MTDKGASKTERVGDDKSINFRSSPNFKYMKKYLKSRFEEAGCSEASSTNIKIDQESTNPVETKVNVVVQPPLPPDSPPPDYPPNLKLVKQEVIDDGYEKKELENEKQQEEQEPKTTIHMEAENKQRKPEKCRDFARGNCTWNPCKKSHILDSDDFCKDFANGKCNPKLRPNCRFVHATTFEKESYFRTGHLPHHLRPNIRNRKDARPAQQPQQQQQPIFSAAAPIQPMQMPMYTMVSNTPDFRASCAPPLPPAMSVPSAAVDPALAYMFVPPQPPPLLSPPQPNPDFNEFGNMQREMEEFAPKSCTKCKLSELRYLENVAEMEKLEDSAQSMKEQIALLDQKKTKLLAILTKVLWKDMPN
ncbi:uncharacterized protein LOC128683589 isoform X2 [Plodia interpunctella]|uniref:uncharacterized protein LOC128683589 isoform X2 n=1 Tax=Plodia interpunctella TaxID=58824 RepID=UPI002368BD9F|nr:uncharacterized protein LOC128683589 isoform X2 [Plodia interpunctella]